MDMPIPIKLITGRIIREAELKRPTPGVVADTKRQAEDGNIYQAMQVFVAGCISNFTAEDGEVISDRADIRRFTASMPFRSADFIAIKAMLLHDDEDGIEGVYRCPRCGKENLAEIDSRRDIDTRDHIGALKTRLMPEPYEDGFDFTLSSELTMPDGTTVSTIRLRWPTLGDCIRATTKVGRRDTIRLQLAIYAEALTQVNGEDVDAGWRSRQATWMFENLPSVKKDANEISNKMMQYGMETEVLKTCAYCGKEWQATVNTANFFASGLQ